MNKTYQDIVESLNNQIWLICMTLQGWNGADVLTLSEQEREWWCTKCEDYQEEIRESMEKHK